MAWCRQPASQRMWCDTQPLMGGVSHGWSDSQPRRGCIGMSPRLYRCVGCLSEAGSICLRVIRLLGVGDTYRKNSQLGLATGARITIGQRECRGIDIADGIGKIGETNGTLS